MAAGYLDILRARHAARLLTGTLVGRLPNGTAHIAIVLFTRAEGGSYTLAGALAAAYGLATAVGQPLLGRAVDLYGQPRVQLPAAVLSALGMALLALTGLGSLPLAYLAVIVAGVATPPLEGGLRALWPSVLKGEGQVHRAYAMDAVAQEIMFTVGPLLVTLLVSLWSPAAALLVINAIGVLGALSVVLSEPSRTWRSAPREAHWLGALRSPGLLALLGAFFFVGLALGSITVAGVAYADDHGREAVYGWLMAALGLGALIGGLAYGARQWAGAPEKRLRVIVGLLALGYLPLTLTPSVPLMTVFAALAGVFLAPAIACSFIVVDRHAPRAHRDRGVLLARHHVRRRRRGRHGRCRTGRRTRLDRLELRRRGGRGVAALVVLLATGRVLAAPVRTAAVVTGSENDRNGAVEPGFSSGHKA